MVSQPPGWEPVRARAVSFLSAIKSTTPNNFHHHLLVNQRSHHKKRDTNPISWCNFAA
ncbi:hypothetical protein [aff. Roholtiella sp. LEGE 12411]|uniref:hypothetical protein n=1 Tax=aff. Roholtiella sp. LEGE 12411 TaxID=1828822 RepID=UPI00188275FB|nr:hypothetical protein [aff. Roholtiella sp. LEGE 12411]MBE9035715.1 hypothetical protein [aff. Roholtiella sp. LEGE 12411]